MALLIKDRVRETSVTTGTGLFTLLGAVTGYQTFNAYLGVGDTTYYTIYNQGTNEWEVGLGTVGVSTIARNTVLASSNANALVDFSAGTKDVFVTYPADKALFLDANNVLNVASLVVTSADINGGSIDGTTIGATTPSSGVFSTLSTPSASITGGSVTGITDLAVADGGTGASNAAGARTNLETPSNTGDGASGTWNISISGSADTANTASVATNAITAEQISNDGGWSVTPVGTDLIFSYNNLDVGKLDSTGNLTVIGNVGIGTSSPGARLDLGTLVSNKVFSLYNDGVNFYGQGIAPAEYKFLTPTTAVFTFSNYNVGTNTSTERMRIDSSGNVGIGTSSPSQRLTVSGGDIGISNGTLNISRTSYPAIQINQSGSTGVGQFAMNGNNLEIRQTQAFDTLFYTNNTERMRIDSSGNVGIGTASPFVKLQIQQDQAAYSYLDFYNVTNGGGIVFRQIVRNLANTGTTTVDLAKLISSGFVINNNDTGAGNFTSFGVGASERMRIDSSGNVGIGTSSPSFKLDVSGSGIQSIRAITTDTSGGNLGRLIAQYTGGGGGAASAIDLRAGDGYTFLTSTTNTPVLFGTNSTERMRIDASGNLLVGTTNTSYSYAGASLRWITNAGLFCSRDTTVETNQITFWNPNGIVGFINTVGSATTYNTSSDYRLKENIAPMTGALETVAQLKPVTYTWKADGSDGQGFIAHELQAVVPDAVTGEKDAVDADGNPVYQGVDTSFLVATLTAAIQELSAKVDTLQAELNTLKGN